MTSVISRNAPACRFGLTESLMAASVTVVDYGCGNLLSVSRGLEHSGGSVNITGEPEKIAAAERLVLPGVGAFGKAMQGLNEKDLPDTVRRFVDTGRPFLGICVGMQAMLDYSEEFGRHDGLGLIAGHVEAIPKTGADGTMHPIPHIGWNVLTRENSAWDDSILAGVEENQSVYFVHSFHAVPDDENTLLASCSYDGRRITAALAKDNMTGCQFHPEKSGTAGLRILSDFLTA